MSTSINTTPINRNVNFHGFAESAAILRKPVEKVENVIDKTVDSYIQDKTNEEKKKSYKTAIKVLGGVFALSGLVAIFNPKFSRKFLEKTKNISEKAGTKAKTHTGTIGKLYDFWKKCSNAAGNLMQAVGNSVSMKDTAFKWFCCEKKEFNFLNKVKPLKKACKYADKGVRKVLTKPYNGITEFFDKISKQTVVKKYKSVTKSTKFLDNLIGSYKTDLPLETQLKIDEKLKQISLKQDYFSQYNVEKRLAQQENLMQDLEKQTRERIKMFLLGFNFSNMGKLKDGLNFWAKDIMQPVQDKLEKQGLDASAALIGNTKGKKGLYTEIFELMEPHISSQEKKILEDALNKTRQKLTKATKIENIEYFDKKRDLMLGSAPTDILTALVGLGASGIAISKADDKESRISKAITLGFPVFAGFGANLIMTAMLTSGPWGILAGTAVSLGLNKLGIQINKAIFPKPTITANEETTEKKEELNV